ncbi:hypothetical protein LG52_895 [Geobacillus kaustophilus]|uniref:Uncharacterized protein n=1 Tax=Geobacillus kaustophilus TaxID=1462 RepID=A0A0D8BR44_GEOKU|nr:hypothetical protein LG52_895 [Geobacillus kaustophilus]
MLFFVRKIVQSDVFFWCFPHMLFVFFYIKLSFPMSKVKKGTRIPFLISICIKIEFITIYGY